MFVKDFLILWELILPNEELSSKDKSVILLLLCPRSWDGSLIKKNKKQTWCHSNDVIIVICSWGLWENTSSMANSKWEQEQSLFDDDEMTGS